MEQSTYSCEGEDPRGDLETLEAWVTPVSTLHMRAVRALKFCSISVSPATKQQNVFVTCTSVSVSPVEKVCIHLGRPLSESRKLRKLCLEVCKS